MGSNPAWCTIFFNCGSEADFPTSSVATDRHSTAKCFQRATASVSPDSPVDFSPPQNTCCFPSLPDIILTALCCFLHARLLTLPLDRTSCRRHKHPVTSEPEPFVRIPANSLSRSYRFISTDCAPPDQQLIAISHSLQLSSLKVNCPAGHSGISTTLP